jgi:hypothetical protein
MGKEAIACRREPYLASQALEQTRVQFIFQLDDLLGQRRLRDVCLLRGTGEAAGFGGSAEITQLMQLHERFPRIGYAYALYKDKILDL